MRSLCVLALFALSAQYSSRAHSIGPNKMATVQGRPLSSDEGLQIRVKGHEHDYNLQLKKPANSIFAPGFKFTVLDVNEAGVQEFQDVNLSADDLKAAEQQIYLDLDPVSNAVLKVEETGGQYRVHGIIANSKISHHQDERHILTPAESPSQNIDFRINDYVDLHRNITEGISTRQAVTTASPEVLILFDYANFQQFSGNVASINDYLSVFYHAVNNRFSTISNPKITVTVSGVLAFNSRAAQPFLEESKIPDGTGYDMSTVLDKLSYWVYANKNGLAKHDVASLISAETFKSKDSSGTYVEGVAGLAYLAGACWTYSTTRYLGTSVNADKGGYWRGVFTAAHELAHNLNAPHDGDSGSGTCPWGDGYIMSYQGWGTKNKFYFSSCSQSLMANFINSASGACVKSFQAPSRWTLSQDNPGDRLDMSAQCKKHLNNPSATAETNGRTPQDICRNLKCRAPAASAGSYYIYTLNRVPGDDTPCGTNLVCQNGECVADNAAGK